MSKQSICEKLKLFLNFFFPCLGSILAILCAKICICLNIFIVPLLTLVPHLKITNYCFVIGFIHCGFLHCELMSYSKCTVKELLLIVASNFFKLFCFIYILLSISFKSMVVKLSTITFCFTWQFTKSSFQPQFSLNFY